MTWWVSLYSVVLCCILLYCVVLCCTVLYYVVLCCILLYCVVLCCTVLYYVVLCCIMLSYVVFCCAVLYSVILCCILFCCTVLFSFWPLSSPHLTVNDLVNIVVYSVMLCRAHADHRICRFLRFSKKKMRHIFGKCDRQISYFSTSVAILNFDFAVDWSQFDSKWSRWAFTCIHCRTKNNRSWLSCVFSSCIG